MGNKIIILSIVTIFITTPAWACEQPTKNELSSFFSGNTKWTEVESKTSKNIATRNPIELKLSFNRPSNTKATWGNNSFGGKTLKVCRGKNKNHITITEGYKTLELYRLGRGIIKSTNSVTGTYYYRPASQVVRSEKLTELHRLPARSSSPTVL